jgi:aspartate aminotransferase
MKLLSNLVNRINPSPTLKITDLARSLKAKGKDIVSLSAGEPDFDTPAHICEAAIQAIKDGQTHYTPVGGTPALKDAIITKLKRDNGLDYTPANIVASTGAKQAIFNLFLALLEKGDEIIIPAPYWVSYADITLAANATPVYITAEQNQQFKITAQQLEAAITPKTKMFIINSPSNPSGQHYTQEELADLAQVLLKYPNIYIASDDIYEHLIWEGKFCNILNACPELYNRTIIINGVSKGYAMTGWRIGFAAGPKEIIGAMQKLQSQSTSNPCSIAQAAAVAAFIGPQDCISEMLKIYKKRHDFVYSKLQDIPGISCIKSSGTFYIFFNVQEVLQKNTQYKTDLELGEYLINNGIALVPGTAFGMPGYMRLSFAASEDTLQKGLDKLNSAICGLLKNSHA